MEEDRAEATMLKRLAILAVAIAAPARGAVPPKPTPHIVLVAPPELSDRDGRPLPRTITFTKDARDLVAGPMFRLKQELKTRLVDYSSARFRNVVAHYVTDAKTGIVICGEINASNRAGGYGGWDDFVYRDEKLQIATGATVFCQTGGGFTDDRDYSADLAP